MAFHTDRITIYVPKEKQMGLTRPKVSQVEKKPKSQDGHFWVSMFKSVLRLIGCYALWTSASVLGVATTVSVAAVPLAMAAGFFAAAEVLGIIEELV